MRGTRETFGQKLAEHEAIAFQIADMRVQLEAARVLTYRAALLSEDARRRRFSKESSMAKVYATEAGNAIAEPSRPDLRRIRLLEGVRRSSGTIGTPA